MSATDLTRPSLDHYRSGAYLTAHDIAILRVRLRTWIDGEGRFQPGAARLRAEVDDILTQPGIDWWLERARDAGLDPLIPPQEFDG